ncbi:DUF397 domain-containing protein [Microbispora sp. NPDC049125]|uniref:DUF397 domain-containing protein n=1 Tax=Microbispora sp. NPDC049125 TaxID=3154929 RepID=UPI0034679E59
MMRPTFEGAVWHSICNGGNCVQVAFQAEWVALRDGKAGEKGPILTFTAEEWRAFVGGVRNGYFDMP